MKRNIAGQKISSKMLTLADGTAYTGAVSVFVDIDGATQAAGLGTVTHKGNGLHEYTPTQAETDGAFISFSFVGTATIDPTIQVYTSFPQSVDNNTILATLPIATDIVSNGAITTSSGSVSRVTLVDTTTENTDMRGTNSANTVAPDNASIAAILLDTGTTLPASLATIDSNVDAILSDTNELQLNQGNWLTATGFATTAEIADVPTVAEFNARTLPSTSYFDPTTDSVTLNVAQPSITFQPMTITASGTNNNITLSGSGTGSGLEFSRSGTSDLYSAIWTSATESVIWDTAIASHISVGTTGEALSDTLTTSGYTAPDNASIANILIDTDELQLNQGNWITATGFSTFNPASDNVSVDRILGTTLVETTTTNIADNISTFFDNANADTTKVVDDVGTAVSGGGEFTATEKNQLRYRLGLDGANSVPVATPDLSTQASIDALNDFNPATDTVANVTLVDTTTTASNMRGTDSAATAASLATLDGKVGDMQGATFNSATDSLEAIRDRGDSAWITGAGGGTGLTAQETRDAMKLAPSVGAPEAGSIDLALNAIEADTNELQLSQGDWATATGFATTAEIANVPTVSEFNARTVPSADYFLVTDYTAPDNATISSISTAIGNLNDISAADVWASAARTLTSGTNISLAKGVGITGLNDLSFSDIWTGQLTESYAVAGQAPTPTQAIMLNQQFLNDFAINTTSYVVRGLDGVTTVATFTLDDDTNPTSIERTS